MRQDEQLHRLLQSWTIEPKTSGSFRANVWARIRARQEEREAVGIRGFIRWLFPRPIVWQLATVTAALMLAIGAVLGTETGKTQNERTRSELAQRYAQSLDPYLQTHLGNR